MKKKKEIRGTHLQQKQYAVAPPLPAFISQGNLTIGGRGVCVCGAFYSHFGKESQIVKGKGASIEKKYIINEFQENM